MAINNEQYERLCRCARASRTDNYGLILEGIILTIGEAALRPGEIFALHHNDIDYPAGLIHLHRHLDLASGVTAWPKDDEPRTIAMTPKLHQHLKKMPRLSEEILIPRLSRGDAQVEIDVLTDVDQQMTAVLNGTPLGTVRLAAGAQHVSLTAPRRVWPTFSDGVTQAAVGRVTVK